jgi:endonuclease/exonuclease/phosphatase family metal-dependent hydrolase
MRTFFFVPVLACVGCADAEPVDETSSELTVASATVKVTTYNIRSKRYDDKAPNNTWASRKDAVRGILMQAETAPEILGVQEGQVREQIDALTLRMGPDYDQYVTALDISPRAIYWKKDEYGLVASNTIDILGGTGISDFVTTRYASYVRLKHRATGKMLLVFNVHLPWGATPERYHVREVAAGILAKKVKAYSHDFGDIPAIVMGDFNGRPAAELDGAHSPAVELTGQGLVDTFAACVPSARVNPDYDTTNNLVGAKARIGTNGSKRLDFIFLYPSANIEVLDWRNILDFAPGSTVDLASPVPSDHNPVHSRFKVRWLD